MSLPPSHSRAAEPLRAAPPASHSGVLGAEELEQVVSAFNDPVRIARQLAGAGRANDWGTELIVRGGSPDQTGFLVDGIPLARVSHYEGMRGEHGGVGILNPAFIDSVEFHPGTFAARYPDRLSGLVEVRYRDGDEAARHGRLGTDLAGAGGSAEGPLPGGLGSYAAAARYSAMDLLIRSGLIEAYGVPEYFNGQARVSAPIGRNALRARFVGGREEWTNRIGDASYLDMEGYSLSSALSLESEDAGSDGRADLIYEERGHRFDFASWGRKPGSGGDDMTRRETARERRWSAAVERPFSPAEGWNLRFGASAQANLGSYRIRHGDEAMYLAYQDTVVQFTQDAGSRRGWMGNGAAFAEATWTRGRAELYAGYRHFYEQASRRHAFGPRLASVFRPAPGQALRLAFGLHTQPHEYADLSQRPDPRQAELPYMAHGETGWEWSPRKGLMAGLALFAKEGYRLPRRSISPLAGGTPQVYRDSGRTRARGIEASARIPRGGRWDLSAAYSFLLYRERYPDGRWGPGPYSLPHTLNLAAGAALGRGLRLSGRFSAGSGSPYTPFDTAASKRAGTGVYAQEKEYSRRGHAYFRVDARLDWERSLRGTRISLFAEVENLFDRRNESGRQWNILDGKETPIEGMGRLPVAGISVNF